MHRVANGLVTCVVTCHRMNEEVQDVSIRLWQHEVVTVPHMDPDIVTQRVTQCPDVSHEVHPVCQYANIWHFKDVVKANDNGHALQCEQVIC
eukprot:2227519-Rhodomonas_salina.2